MDNATQEFTVFYGKLNSKRYVAFSKEHIGFCFVGASEGEVLSKAEEAIALFLEDVKAGTESFGRKIDDFCFQRASKPITQRNRLADCSKFADVFKAKGNQFAAAC